jgi:hypothetical protein
MAMKSAPSSIVSLAVVAPLFLAAACSGKNESCGPNGAGYDPTIDPAQFSTRIDNQYLSYPPGTVARYRQSGGEIVEQDVLTDRKVVMGVEVVTVHDFLKSPSGALLEDTLDYFAQDRDGNVWYFGEDTKAYVGQTVTAAGSWLAGQSCARPGIVMKGRPTVGERYRQEYLEGEAEDEAEVVGLDETVTVPYARLSGCVKTREFTRLAPGDLENKYYCPGTFGPVSSVDVGTIDAGKTEDLISINGKTAP